jgi:hypothetical protein
MYTQINANIIKMILEDAFFLILKDYIVNRNPSLEWIESLDREMQNRNNKMPKEIAQLLLYVTEIIQDGKYYSIFNKQFCDDSNIIYQLEYKNKEITLTKVNDLEIIKDDEVIMEIMLKNLLDNKVKIIFNSFLQHTEFKNMHDIRNFLINKYSL